MVGRNAPNTSTPKPWKVALDYLACYVMWLIICAIGVSLIFLLRNNLVNDVFFLRVNPWQLRAIDRWSIFVFGIVWVVAVFLLEGYLRQAVERRILWQRVGRILLVQAALVGLSMLISLL